MLGIIFAIFTAIFESGKDLLSKRSLKQFDEYAVSFGIRFFALLFFLPTLFFIKIPEIGKQFWIALIISGGINIVTTILYMKAIKTSHISLSVPMITFTPLFLLITSPLIVGEYPSLLGILGVILIVAGAYMLNIKKFHEGYLEPFKALIKETGPRYLLVVAFLWSISSNFDKIGVQNSSSLFWALSINLFLTIGMLPIMLLKTKSNMKNTAHNMKYLLPIGFFSALALFCQFTAINLTLVPYVISIKRTSVILSVIGGAIFFREKNIKERLLGASIMVAGVVLIALS